MRSKEELTKMVLHDFERMTASEREGVRSRIEKELDAQLTRIATIHQTLEPHKEWFLNLPKNEALELVEGVQKAIDFTEELKILLEVVNDFLKKCDL